VLVKIAQGVAKFCGCFFIDVLRRGGEKSALKGIELRGRASQQCEQGAYLLRWRRFNDGQQSLLVAQRDKPPRASLE